jgi:hypothetical protein
MGRMCHPRMDEAVIYRGGTPQQSRYAFMAECLASAACVS